MHWIRWVSNGDPLIVRSNVTTTIEERFWAKVDRRCEGECWPWIGSCFPNGYGAFKSERMTTAHRAAYELLVGPIPEGLHLDHLCRNRVCVNPAHLDPVTAAENNRRAAAARRQAS